MRSQEPSDAALRPVTHDNAWSRAFRIRLLLILGAVLSACLAAVGWALGFHDPGDRE